MKNNLERESDFGCKPSNPRFSKGILDFGCKPINPAYCKTCLFAHGKPPFADAPDKSYCEVYRKEDENIKPSDVYYDGARCDFYVPEE